MNNSQSWVDLLFGKWHQRPSHETLLQSKNTFAKCFLQNPNEPKAQTMDLLKASLQNCFRKTSLGKTLTDGKVYFMKLTNFYQ